MAGTIIANGSPTIVKDSENKKAVRVILSADNIPLPVDAMSGATDIKITNLSLPTPNTEVSHVLSTDLKEVIIKSRVRTDVKVAFIATQSGTNYFSIPGGSSLNLERLNFTGETLYIQSDTATTIEIIELHS